MSRTPDDSEGEQVADWASVSALEERAECFQNGKYGRRLAAKNPQWGAKLIGKLIYKYTLVIMREYGYDAKGGKINSRTTVGQECETALWGKWGTGNRSM